MLWPYAGGVAASQASPEHNVERKPLARPERPALLEARQLFCCPSMEAVAAQALDLDADRRVGLDVLTR